MIDWDVDIIGGLLIGQWRVHQSEVANVDVPANQIGQASRVRGHIIVNVVQRTCRQWERLRPTAAAAGLSSGRDIGCRSDSPHT